MQDPAPAQPSAVAPGLAATDNCLLLCANEETIITSAELLCMLSVEVLAHTVEVARSACGDGDGKGHIELPLRKDSATDWMQALRLVHPAVLPKDRPKLARADAMRIILLADKYALTSIKEVCADMLADSISGTTGIDVAELLSFLDFAVEQRLRSVYDACCNSLAQLLQVREFTAAERDRIKPVLCKLKAFHKCEAPPLPAPAATAAAKPCLLEQATNWYLAAINEATTAKLQLSQLQSSSKLQEQQMQSNLTLKEREVQQLQQQLKTSSEESKQKIDYMTTCVMGCLALMMALIVGTLCCWLYAGLAALFRSFRS